jgi:hypothetical protein
VLLRARLSAVANSPDASQKLAKAERLADIVVGAEFQPNHPDRSRRLDDQ